MVNAGPQHLTNPSWPRKRRRHAGQAKAFSAAVVDAAPRRKPFRHLAGRKYVKRLDRFIGDLRANNPHPNRDLYFDDVVTILLLGFFNSDIRSLRKQQCKNNFVFFDEKAGMIKSVNGLTRSTIRCRRHPFTVANVRFAGNQSRTPISNCTIV